MTKQRKIIRCSNVKGMVLFFTLLIFLSPVYAQTVTEQNLQDAILENKTFTTTELQGMDVNKDGKIDVADLVAIPPPISQKESRYIGTMSFDQEFALAPQEVDMVIGQTGSDATFDIGDSPFFSDPFKMNGSFGTDTVTFSSEGTGVFETDSFKKNPLNKDISWRMKITDATLKDGAIQAKFTMIYIGLKQGSKALDVTGTLYLRGQIASEGLSFKDANNMTLLAQKYPVQ